MIQQPYTPFARRFRLLTLAALLLAGVGTMSAKDYRVSSPDGKNIVTVSDSLKLIVSHNGKEILTVLPDLAVREIARSKVLVYPEQSRTFPGAKFRFARSKVVTEKTEAPFYRQKNIQITGRQIELAFSNGFSLQIRAYDEGVAYRWVTTNRRETVIVDETADFCFPEDAKAWLAYSTNDKNPYAMAFQNYYDETLLSQAQDKLAFLPATIQRGDVKVTILESDLRNYPGMFLKKDKARIILSATFAKYPKKMAYYKWRGMSYVDETEDFIAKSTGARTYPWRVMAITEKDTGMPVNNLVYTLASPNQIGATDWIKPGKVAWDWWNDWNLKGVDFEAGTNTRTYLYYIDFAAKNHLPYVVLDEGWYDSSKGDIMNPIADIDLQQLIDYGKEKGVGIVLWTVFNVLDEHLEEACEKYAAMGVKGFKVDFLDRNDQTAVEMAERIAIICALNQLFLDYHGYFAPTGMSRTYPNILNYEGVFGMEEARWAKKETDMPRYDVTFPYIRMMAGSVDFTPGAMRNGTKQNWVECYQNPVSMGTRCHQAACYVVQDSPFTMLCDTPTNYEAEPAYTSFIAAIPDEWDETRILQGELGQYIVTARRKGNIWYVGGQTNWDQRTIELPLTFLGEGSFTTTLLTDGINANHNAEDYRLDREVHASGDMLSIRMASGGGFVLLLEPSR